MSRRRIVEVALRAYPLVVRKARGAEMRDTTLDLAGGSIWRLMVEGFGLVRGGLMARASGSVLASKRDLLSDCCARVAIVCGLLFFTSWLGSERWAYTSTRELAQQNIFHVIAEGLLLALATGLALVGRRRLAGIAGLGWIGLYLSRVLSRSYYWMLSGTTRFADDVHWVALIVVPLGCYLVMLIAPGSPRRRSGRLGWLLGVWLLGGIVAGPNAPLELFGSIGIENVLLIAVLAAGVCLLAVDAWRPVALALALLSFGLGAWTWLSVYGRYEDLPLVLTTTGPILLMSGAGARLLLARRRLPS